MLSGCQQNQVVENGGVSTDIEITTESTTTTAETEVSEEETTTKATTTTAKKTTTTPPETKPEETSSSSATSAPNAGNTPVTGGQNASGNATANAQPQQTAAATAATAAPQTAAQTFQTTLEHVSGYRYGSTKYELKHDIDYMKDLNSDFVGWLTIDDTPIDLPVVQGTDNKFYLEHDFYGAYDYTKVGATFADCHVPITETSRPDNIVIYGHNIRTGVGLAKVTNYYPARYGSLNFYINHPIVYFDSILGDQYQYVVFAGMFVNTQTKHGDVFNYHRFRNFDSQSIFYQYFEAVFDRSVFYNPDLDIRYDDKFLTLSTCYYPYGEAVDTRFVIFARQLRPGENVVTTKNAYINRSPLYFDYYYAMNGGSWAGRNWPTSLMQGYSDWIS